MKLKLKGGTTSRLMRIFVSDSSSTTGAGLAGLTSGSSGLTWYWCRSGDSSTTAVTIAAGTLGTWSSGGFVAVDGTNMPGVYEVGIPNAAIAAGSPAVHMMLKGATNMTPVLVEIEIDAIDYQDSVRAGLTGLANATPGAAGGLLIAGTNAPVTITGSGNALTLTSTGGNGSGLAASGNGSGDGVTGTGGATGHGVHAIGGATSGSGLRGEGTANSNGATFLGAGTGNGVGMTGGATGHGLNLTGGATSGHGLNAATTSGDGFHLAPTAGNGIVATANGLNMHGIVATGGAGGVGDGIKGVAGSGVDIRGNITGNVTGNLSGSVGSVTGAVGSISGVTFPTNFASFAIDASGRVDLGKVLGTASAGAAGYVGIDWAHVNAPTTAVVLSGTTIGTLTTNGDKTGYALTSGEHTAIAGDVLNATASSYNTSLTIGNKINAAGSAGDPWTTTLPGSYGAGTAGNILGNGVKVSVGTGAGQINVASGKVPATLAATDVTGNVACDLQTIKTQAVTAAAGVTFPTSIGTSTYAGGAVASVTGNVGGNVVGSVASVTAGVTVTTNNDKTGYSLTQAFPTNFAALGISVGGHVSNVDTLTTYTGNTPQTGDSFARLGAPAGASIAADIATRSTFAGGAVASVTGAVGSVTAPVTITSNVKKNAALSGFPFVMTDSTNHAPAAGLTVTATRSLDGGAFSACANAPAGVANGSYKIDLAAADTNGNTITLRFTATGADDLFVTIVTQP